jgi:hypothetical protein
VRRHIEEQMQREGYRTSWLQESYLKGKKEGTKEGEKRGEKRGATRVARESLKTVLFARGLLLSDDLERRINAERDITKLQRWMKAALKAKSAAAALADS